MGIGSWGFEEIFPEWPSKKVRIRSYIFGTVTAADMYYGGGSEYVPWLNRYTIINPYGNGIRIEVYTFG